MSLTSPIAGSEPLESLSKVIWSSVGPSGPNKEYLLNLAMAVRELSPKSYDSHLFALEVSTGTTQWFELFVTVCFAQTLVKSYDNE